MKQLTMALTMAIAIFCFGSINANAQTKKAPVKVADTTAKMYQCPMKCEGEKMYSKAGKCPKCGMYMKAKSKIMNGMAMYQCPMKCEGEKMYSKAGKCPKCNMELAKMGTKKKMANH